MRMADRAAMVRRHGAALALLAGSFCVGLVPPTDGDVWWHLAAGREIVRSHAIPSVDVFSVSAAGRPWTDVHWLFQLVSYGLYVLGGLAVLVAFKCLLVAVGAFVLLRSVQRGGGRRASGVFVAICLAALLLARPLLLLRPVIPTLLFVALFFAALERFRRDGDRRALVLLPLIQIVWANVQGLFAMGPAMVAAYALGEAADGLRRRTSRTVPGAGPVNESRPLGGAGGAGAPPAQDDRKVVAPLAATLVACAAACLVTPYGSHSLALALTLLRRIVPVSGNVYSANVVENAPPFSLEELGSGEFWHLPWFLAVLVVGVVVAGRRLVSARAIIVLGLSVLALMANRNVLLLYWLGAPITALNLTPAIRRIAALVRRTRLTRAANGMAAALFVGLLGMVGFASASEPSLGQPAPFRAPVKSAAILAGGARSGTIFAADHYGGYLIWTLYPRFRPYIDTRLVLRSPREFADYLDLADHPELFDDFQRAHGFDYVLLPVAYPDRYLGLIAHLYSSPEWSLTFTDGTEVLFARHGRGDEAWELGHGSTTASILRAQDAEFRDSPHLRSAARIHLATLDVAVGEFFQAERVLDGDSSREAQVLRARCRLAAGDLGGAEAIAKALLSVDPEDVPSLNVMAVILLRRGEAGRAVVLLQRALRKEPLNMETDRILASLEDHVDSR
jgi:hypothetical protein